MGGIVIYIWEKSNFFGSFGSQKGFLKAPLMVELIHRTSSEGTRNSRVNKNENQTGFSIERPNQIYEATHGHASWVVVLSQHSYKVTPPSVLGHKLLRFIDPIEC